MVDFPIRKWDFWVCGWSGAFWGALERKKRENQMYLQSPLSGEKKCKHFSSPEKKGTFGGEQRGRMAAQVATNA